MYQNIHILCMAGYVQNAMQVSVHSHRYVHVPHQKLKSHDNINFENIWKEIIQEKLKGAIVWHRNELKKITSQNVGKYHVVLNDLIKIKKSSINLAKIGDYVEFKDLSVLPQRCATLEVMKITYFHQNGNIGTDKDLYPKSDSTHYGHFRSPFYLHNGRKIKNKISYTHFKLLL